MFVLPKGLRDRDARLPQPESDAGRNEAPPVEERFHCVVSSPRSFLRAFENRGQHVVEEAEVEWFWHISERATLQRFGARGAAEELATVERIGARLTRHGWWN
jgi:hypothetical protein